MVGLLFLLFVVVPLVEIYVFVVVAGAIGVLPAIAVLMACSLLGLWLVKREGLGVLRRMQATVNRGEVPAAELVDGALLAFAGAMCLIPGFVTDALGLLLVLPPVRHLARNLLIRRWTKRGTFPGAGRFVGGAVVDVEYVGDVTPERPQGGSPPIELGPGR
jgi:UPF0716 protein FxsA